METIIAAFITGISAIIAAFITRGGIHTTTPPKESPKNRQEENPIKKVPIGSLPNEIPQVVSLTPSNKTDWRTIGHLGVAMLCFVVSIVCFAVMPIVEEKRTLDALFAGVMFALQGLGWLFVLKFKK